MLAMEEDQAQATPPKRSALMVALIRAAHQLLDSPIVFPDPVAIKILGKSEEQSLRDDPDRFNSSAYKSLRASLVIRSRLASDIWTDAISSGATQYVILGAGLDTSAYRIPLDPNVRIFEVDLPATQAWKRHCLKEAGVEEPPNITFVPVDFESSTLAEMLEKAGFFREKESFFSWLGVTMYLEEAAVFETLSYIVSLAPGTSVLFDYGLSLDLLAPRERPALEALSARTAEHGEPWKTFFYPEAHAAKLRNLGFSKMMDYGAHELNERYLSGREDGLRKSGISHLMYATV
jgi:methyltransferase (TIGR00027 family)